MRMVIQHFCSSKNKSYTVSRNKRITSLSNTMDVANKHKIEKNEVTEDYIMGNTCNSMVDSCQCMTKPTEML